MRSDRTLLRRILQNIFSNALRYTSIAAACWSAQGIAAARIRIEVADTGCGIPDDQREAVFEEFHRGATDHRTALSGGGLGLGLAIVRAWPTALGHPVTFSSKVGNGTIFRIDVPAGIGASADGIAGAAEHGTSARLWPVRHARCCWSRTTPTCCKAMTSLLERWQCVVRAATTTDEALDMLGDTDWVPDIVIADQHLDDGDLGTARSPKSATISAATFRH